MVPAAAIAAALFATGAVAGGALEHEPSTAIVVNPVTVDVPAPIITVNTPPPAAAEAPPAAPTAAVPAPEPRPRAVGPIVLAECVLPSPDADSTRHCEWDDGFPAVAGDGSLIVTKQGIDDGGRGYPGLSISFLDARTGDHVRSEMLLDPEEYAPLAEDSNAQYTDAWTRLQSKIRERAVAIQRELDAASFRSLALLASSEETDDAAVEAQRPYGKPYAEIAGAAVRLVDPIQNSVIWQRNLAIPSPNTDDGTSMCPGWNLRAMTVWWDPTTELLFAAQSYRTGGCMCSDSDTVHVFQL